MRSVLASLAGIVAAGGAGAALAWWIVRALAIDGLPGALLTVVLAMVIALAVFALGVHIGNKVRSRS